MTVLVRRSESEYQLHDDDGEVIESWDWSGNWIVDDNESIEDKLTSEYIYRDLTLSNEVVPW